jgi:hypothetical protein
MLGEKSEHGFESVCLIQWQYHILEDLFIFAWTCLTKTKKKKRECQLFKPVPPLLHPRRDSFPFISY